MHIVKKNISGHDYYYLNKSVREGSKVRSINVAYLGKDKVDAERKAKEIIEKLKSEKTLKEADEIIKQSKKKELRNQESKKGSEEKEFTSFIQEKGLIWGPSPEIYGGLAGFYTYGPVGKLLKNKVENSVRKIFNANGLRELEAPTVLPDIVWKASGHLETFTDKVIKCSKCNAIFRADKLIEEGRDISADSFSDKKILDLDKYL